MNWQHIEGNWNLFKGKVREQWADLTDNDLEHIAGRRQQLVGRVQRTYGLMMEEAERRVQAWEAKFRDELNREGD